MPETKKTYLFQTRRVISVDAVDEDQAWALAEAACVGGEKLNGGPKCIGEVDTVDPLNEETAHD